MYKSVATFNGRAKGELEKPTSVGKDGKVTFTS